MSEGGCKTSGREGWRGREGGCEDKKRVLGESERRSQSPPKGAEGEVDSERPEEVKMASSRSEARLVAAGDVGWEANLCPRGYCGERMGGGKCDTQCH